MLSAPNTFLGGSYHAQVCVQDCMVVGEELLQLLGKAGHVLWVAVGNLGGDRPS